MDKYSISIQWSDADQSFIASVPELKGLSAFGSTPESAIKELVEAKKLYLEVLKEDGEDIPDAETLKPFSGQLRIRMPKSLHATLSSSAKQDGVSLNTFIVHLLAEKITVQQIGKEIFKLKNEIEVKLRNKSATQATSSTIIIAKQEQPDWANEPTRIQGVIYSDQKRH